MSTTYEQTNRAVLSAGLFGGGITHSFLCRYNTNGKRKIVECGGFILLLFKQNEAQSFIKPATKYTKVTIKEMMNI